MVLPTDRIDLVQAVCSSCKNSVELLVNADDWMDWKRGKLIQDAMPYLSVSEREILISGICGTCFDNMFGGDPLALRK